MTNAFDRPVPTLAQQTQYMADAVNASGRTERQELAERQALIERQAAERAAQGLELYPLATWNAFSPDQLADVITGVTRSDPEFGLGIARRVVKGESPFEFGTERRDLSGALIGGALWRAERAGVSSFKLHLLQSEPGGVA